MERSNQKTYINKQKKKKTNKSYTSSNKHYQTNFWRNTTRARKRKYPLCAECERVGITKAAEVTDHIEPIPAGADLDTFIMYSTEDNLQSLCLSHNLSKRQESSKE